MLSGGGRARRAATCGAGGQRARPRRAARGGAGRARAAARPRVRRPGARRATPRSSNPTRRVDLSTLPWPAAQRWVARVAAASDAGRGRLTGTTGRRRRAPAAAGRLAAVPRPLLARGADGGRRPDACSARRRCDRSTSELLTRASHGCSRGVVAVATMTCGNGSPRLRRAAPAGRDRRRTRHRQDDDRRADRRAALRAGARGGRAPPLVALAAPTGKAAARLQEAVHERGRRAGCRGAVRAQLLALRASTIHRLLGWRPGSHSRFRHDRSNRLPHDVVIVDETSMVSLSLMARLVEAVRPGGAAGARRRPRAADLDRGRRGAARHRRPGGRGRHG